MSRSVEYRERVSLGLGRFMDDPVGLAEAMDAVEALGEDPYPPASFPYGPRHRRLHIGVFRVTYEITDKAVIIINVGRSL